MPSPDRPRPHPTALRPLAGLVAALLVLALATLAPVPPGATAQTAAARQQGQRMVTAFRAWANRWNVPNAALVVMHGDDMTGSAGRGSYTPSAPVPLASLSKAITAVCVARLVDQGRLRFDDRLDRLLPQLLAAHPPRDTRVRSITVAQLITHTSGLGADLALDPAALARGAGGLLRTTLTAPLHAAPGRSFRYSNAGYLLLGLMIEARTGQSYETACRNRVLAPLGITRASLHPDWRIAGPFGGWRMPLTDYARFLTHYLPGRTRITTPPGRWPRFDLGSGRFYGLGAYSRRRGSDTLHWHAGSFSGQIGRNRISHSAWFMILGPRLRYVVADAPQVSAEARRDLERAMLAAAFP
jgi:CubicO group peptidase (beta-lactamase class C family)